MAHDIGERPARVWIHRNVAKRPARLGGAIGSVVEGLERRRLLSVAGAPSAVYVNAAWAGSGQGQTVSDGYGTHTFGLDAFATIQGGVNAVASSGTVYTDAGTYNELVTINQPVALIGNQHDVAGTAPSRKGATSSESILNGGSGTAVNVTSGGVSINGMDITGATGITSGPILVQDDIINTSGQDIALVASGNITVNNNALTSTGGNAIQIQGSPASPDVSIQNNSISGGAGGIIIVAATGNLTLGNVTASGNTITSANGGSISLLASSGSVSLGNLVADNNTTSGDVSISGFGAQLTSLDFSGNSLGGNFNLSANGTTTGTGDLTIGDPAAAQNQAITISGNRTETVDQNQTITISANRDVVVSGNVTISGNRTETVSQNGSITVSSGRDLTVDGNTTVSVNQNQSITIGANRTETVSKNDTITVSGNRTETVGNNQTITIGGGKGDLALGNLTVSGNTLNAVKGGSAFLLSAGGSLAADSLQVLGNTIGGTAGHDAIDIFAGTLGASAGSILIQSNNVTGGAGATGINLVASGTGATGGMGGSINILSNTIGGSAAADGINVSGANGGSVNILSNTIGGSAAADGITVSNCGANAPNVISVSSNNITLSGSSGNGGAILVTSCTGNISVSGNSVLDAADDSGIYLFADGSTSTLPISVSNNNLTGGNGFTGTGVGINLDQSSGGLVYADMASNTIGGFGTGVHVLSTGAADLVNATIGGSASSDSNTVQSCAIAILVTGSGATATVSHNSDPIYMEYEGVKGESGGEVRSDHNKWIQVNSFQFGVGRGITSSTGATVTSDHDTITLLPGVPDNVGIYVDGGNFHATNDLIDGGGNAATPSSAVGLYVSPNNLPTESISLNFTKIQFVNKAFIDNTSSPGVVVDASGDYWGTNSESGIANTIGGAAAAEIDYTPWLDNGTNLIPPGPGSKANPGFEGDFSALDVGLGGAQVQTGGRISEAIGLLAPGGAIQVYAGTYSDTPIINNNMMLRSADGSASTIINGAITIQAGITLHLQFASTAPLQISGLVIAPGGTLDLTRSSLLISYAGQADPIASIRDYLSGAYDNGKWDMSGMTSTAAGSNPLHNTAIGYADWNDRAGVNMMPNTVELKYTLMGDSNLSGNVNSADLQALLSRFNLSGAWDQGDFNYSGNVNSADLQALLSTFNTSLGNQAMAVFAPSIGASSQSSQDQSKPAAAPVISEFLSVPRILPANVPGAHHALRPKRR